MTNATPPLMPSSGVHGEHGPMANLSEVERAQVKAAHDKAIQQNPILDQKMKSAHQAMEDAKKSMHDAMVAVDPSVEPILSKMMPPKWSGKHEGAAGNRGGQNGIVSPAATSSGTNASAWQQPVHREPAGMARLTEGERQQLKSIHERSKNDPAVLATKEAKRNATTPEARNAAEEALHQAMNAAMIKADPSIEPILAKLHAEGNTGGAGQSTPSPSVAPMVQ